ncbi:MAG: GlxA family transcriptional regulator [Albidovulum sp.]|uniref:GlxA family transcriptional regulator n=1 Tax=Albidovulum sp. TaxID=1872424 RepID=UPI003C83B976
MDTQAALDTQPRRVGILALPGFALMSYAATVEPLRAANLLSRRKLYEVTHFGTAARAAQSSGHAVAPVDALITEAGPLDYLFVVAGGEPASYRDDRVFGWLRRLARTGVTLGGVSGGPVILAQAGLMAGRRMTVHWEHAAALAEADPDLLTERTLYVIDRDRLTCAGGTAPLDLMHALIAMHHGGDFARLVSDWFMHTEVRPAFGPQRSGLAERVGTANKTALDAVSVMEANIAEPLALAALARIAGVTPRQLNRLFTTHVGQTTMGYYALMRLETARRLLRNSSLTVTEVAMATGFATAGHFSTRFRAAFGHPPSALRPRQGG